jgi:putative thiazole-containing bacteriocin maturation protein
MTSVKPSMRLKVKGDTFFLPDGNGGVYFRNNEGWFRMEGRSIHQWIETLIPVFNGELSLADLTDGLPGPHREMVYNIADVLYQNHFVRDVSQDRPHDLSDAVLQKYAYQIEFLDNLAGSGAHRFQQYRQAKVLVIGSGSALVSLVSALLESGLPGIHMLVTDSLPTNRSRLSELEEHHRKSDAEVKLTEITLGNSGSERWRAAIRPFDAVLYVSETGDIEELRALQQACREEKKVLLPALCLEQAGVAGPLVHPDSAGCWESAWRRIHETAICKDPQLHTFSYTAGAMLANVIAFEWFKTVTGVAESELKKQVFLLNLETLEGSWHPFLPHPLVAGLPRPVSVEDLKQRLKQSTTPSESPGLLPYFQELTSTVSGIFHQWEEGELIQLPLAQCRVQPVDPLSTGPATLLPGIICNGMTHEEARKEAGLAGIEAYVSRFVQLWKEEHREQGNGEFVLPEEFVGVGAGESVAEAVCRGLQKCLAEALTGACTNQPPAVSRVHVRKVSDDRCQFYLQALTTMQGTPVIGLGQPIWGLPVVWVNTVERWYGSADLNVTLALRKALQQALLVAQNPDVSDLGIVCAVPTVLLQDEDPDEVVVPASPDVTEPKVLRAALQTLERSNRQVYVFDLAQEPFVRETLAGVFGVVLYGEGSQ